MSANPKFGFSKSEKLCSHISITNLYAGGESFLCYPIRCVFSHSERDLAVVQVLISVPKRNHKRAVVRNMLKRRVREAYRLNKNVITELGVALDISFQYVARDVQEYKKIEDAIKKSLTELSNRLAATAN